MRSLKTKGWPSIHWGHIQRVQTRPIREIQMISPTQNVYIRASAIGRCWVEVLDIIDFTRVLEKRTPNLTIQGHMFNRTTNFIWGRGSTIHNINIYTVQPLSYSINFSRKQSKCINFKVTSNPLRLASFGGALEIV